MNKILRKISIWLFVIGALVFGVYLSDPIFDFIFSQDRLGSIIGKSCDIFGLVDYDILHKSCYHAFCCGQIIVYLFYLFLLGPISFFLFLRKEKLAAILFTVFGVGIILGTFVFFLVMP